MLKHLVEDVDARFERALNRSDNPEDSLAYYERGDDLKNPYKGLSESDLACIWSWMEQSKDLPTHMADFQLTKYHKKLIEGWMKKTENMSLNYQPPKTICMVMVDAWNSLIEKWYYSKLLEYEMKERVALKKRKRKQRK